MRAFYNKIQKAILYLNVISLASASCFLINKITYILYELLK